MSTKHRPSNLDLDKLKSASNKKFAIVCSEWNPEIINRLLDGAYDFFEEIGISKNKIDELKVPGSFELIFGCYKVQSSKKYDAILAIGSVIRGETSHFKYISQSVFDGIKDLNTNGNSPIILCLLTDDNYQQSLDRSGGKHGNKGYDCAAATAKISLI
jgi:6,7-dimethyl-8-ribityllumazine synthase|tara:strand:- start:1893 stop:2366 length:474 start_codon:yes stop_codon:yes gene_type:complete